ncbi:hypothetical protein [Paenarthrobacter ilicis]|uniref:hypothetical protein n=1 Tax=Paenarthrobacter ilicis TaxID=43665 RepID=UPI0028D23F54|nr:hypothetical protein [Paenarthrobacter ilicis]
MSETSGRIQYRHGQLLPEFRAALRETGNGRTRRTWRLGPVASIEDNSTQVTLVAGLMGLGWLLTSGQGPGGIAVTIVIAGHRKDTGIRAALTSSECTAWLHAILGLDWTRSIYRLDGITGASHGPAITTYRLFLDAQRQAMPRPQEIDDGFSRLLMEP